MTSTWVAETGQDLRQLCSSELSGDKLADVVFVGMLVEIAPISRHGH